MHPEMREHFRQKLLEERRRLAGDLRNGGGLAGQALRDSTGELSAYDNHPADLGSETFERGKDLARHRDLQRALADIDAALARLEDGTYGYCQRCGRPIPRERLEALPATAYCLACAEELEETGVRARGTARPVEEERLSPPFGRTWRDGRDEVAFDGEDAWQAVARYGSSDTPQDAGGGVRHPLRYPDVFADADDDSGLVEATDAVLDSRFEPDRALGRSGEEGGTKTGAGGHGRGEDRARRGDRGPEAGAGGGEGRARRAGPGPEGSGGRR